MDGRHGAQRKRGGLKIINLVMHATDHRNCNLGWVWYVVGGGGGGATMSDGGPMLLGWRNGGSRSNVVQCDGKHLEQREWGRRIGDSLNNKTT